MEETMTHNRLLLARLAPLPLMLAACATMPTQASAPGVGGLLSQPSGQPVGSVSVGETATGLTLSVTAGPLAPGTYGIHIHEKGLCDGPAFASAGMHWNPTARQHGRQNPAGSHHGDLPNLLIGADGNGTLSTTTMGTLAALMDADGAAVVLHAAADDGVTDPSGNSGARIACAVLAPN
jgi:superoxide dismutase, Cu-Zn family